MPPPPSTFRHDRTHFLLTLAVLMLAACSNAIDKSPTSGNEALGVAASVIIPGCDTPSGTAYLFKCWENQAVIEVATTSTSSQIRNAIQAGVSRWNSLLGEAPVGYRRSFSWAGTATTNADVVIEVHGSLNDDFCGKEGSGRIYLYQLGTVDCPSASSHYGDIATVIAHELTTVIGWKDGVEDYGVTGISDEYCVSTFRSAAPGPLSTTACYHDADRVLKLYRNGSVDLGTQQDYYGTKILGSSDVALSALTAEVGQSVGITAQYLTAGQHAQYSALVAYGPASYQASFSAPGKVHRSANAIVADSTGTVDVTLRPNSVPSGYAAAHQDGECDD